ncbi:hypothetical protein QBC42DRAFT_257010 [Cladorrhinum samala]|uniref:Uncharacterized protein n=1 Tax=Cladorrhinum samala TaxID=585594 RepID=A0AAV9H8F1_9PEZI|nr:hypothetical protein QBC42DRAFT_257010 [Cladorrhinum samala]
MVIKIKLRIWFKVDKGDTAVGKKRKFDIFKGICEEVTGIGGDIRRGERGVVGRGGVTSGGGGFGPRARDRYTGYMDSGICRGAEAVAGLYIRKQIGRAGWESKRSGYYYRDTEAGSGTIRIRIGLGSENKAKGAVRGLRLEGLKRVESRRREAVRRYSWKSEDKGDKGNKHKEDKDKEDEDKEDKDEEEGKGSNNGVWENDSTEDSHCHPAIISSRND